MFIFDRYRRSTAVVIPVKYECESKNLTVTFARSKILLTENLTNGALATPTQGQRWLISEVELLYRITYSRMFLSNQSNWSSELLIFTSISYLCKQFKLELIPNGQHYHTGFASEMWLLFNPGTEGLHSSHPVFGVFIEFLLSFLQARLCEGTDVVSFWSHRGRSSWNIEKSVMTVSVLT